MNTKRNRTLPVAQDLDARHANFVENSSKKGVISENKLTVPTDRINKTTIYCGMPHTPSVKFYPDCNDWNYSINKYRRRNKSRLQDCPIHAPDYGGRPCRP